MGSPHAHTAYSSSWPGSYLVPGMSYKSPFVLFGYATTIFMPLFSLMRRPRWALGCLGQRREAWGRGAAGGRPRVGEARGSPQRTAAAGGIAPSFHREQSALQDAHRG